VHQLLATTGVVLAGIVSLALAQSESPDDRYNEPTARYMIALGIDGSLEGWAGYVEASSGQFHGAPGALVYLGRAGELIEKVEANANGYFRVVAAVPGVYSVTAIDERGFSASAIQVVAAGEEAAYSSVLCTMIPHADFDVVGRLEDALAAVEAHDVEAKSCCDDAGPTGGRGGGLGGMLGFGIGAAGLAAGIAALNDLNQDRRQTSASPSQPASVFVPVF
jgi:hypothetical protein